MILELPFQPGILKRNNHIESMFLISAHAFRKHLQKTPSIIGNIFIPKCICRFVCFLKRKLPENHS